MASKPKKQTKFANVAQVRPFGSVQPAMAAGLGNANTTAPTATNSRIYVPNWKKIKASGAPVNAMLSKTQKKKYNETGELPASFTSAHMGSHGFAGPVPGVPDYSITAGDPRLNTEWTVTREALRGQAKREVYAGINAPWPNKPWQTEQEKERQYRIARNYWHNNSLWKPTAEGLALMHEPAMASAAHEGARAEYDAHRIQQQYEAGLENSGNEGEENNENRLVAAARAHTNENNDNIEELIAHMTPAELNLYLRQEMKGAKGGKRRRTRKQPRASTKRKGHSRR